MFGIGTPYLALAAVLTAMGLFVGGFLYGGHVKALAWQAATAKLQAEAATTLAAETAKSAATDARNAELANKLDAEHAAALQTIDATRADFSERLRLVASRAGGRCPAASQAADTGGGADAPASSEPQPRGPDLASGGRLRDAALELQAYARTCHAWALEVGR